MPPDSTNPLLRAEGLTVAGKIKNLSVTIGAGEVVGLGGLVGSGRTTVLRALSELEPEAVGRLWIDGVERPWPTSPVKALALGIALVPEDRKQGLVLGMSAQENIVLADLGAAASAGFLSEQRMYECATNAVRGYEFDQRRLLTIAGSLSGGNQQKLLLARWRHQRHLSIGR